MWRLPIAQLLALAALTTVVEADSPGSGAEQPEPIATRQTIFSIPFQIQKAQDPAQDPVEVRLYVSTDRAATWRPYAKVEPSRGHFLFRAVGDGEYWFLVRTLDRSGQVRPQGPNRAELRVMVDTTPPTLQLEAARGDAGQIVTRWKVGELAPKRDTLKIHYRTAPDAPWQPVAIDWRKVKVDGPTQTGEVTWWPPAGAADLQIRAEVADLAGNPAVSHAQVKADRGVDAAAKQQPGESDVAAVTAQKWRPARSETPAATGPDAHAMPDPSAQDRETPRTQPPDNPFQPRNYSDTGDLAADRPGGSSSDGGNRAERRPDPFSARTPPAQDAGRTGPPPDSVAGTVNPAIQNQYVPPGRKETPPEGGDPAGLPSGVRPRMVNSRVFELEYDTGSAGGSGLGRVELWGTRDGGWTWDSFGRDTDGRSPMLVTVPDDGVYGFRVVAQTDPRSPPQKPRSGESPDVWIGVDLSKPTATIVSAERGTGAESDRLIIRWEASDRMLAARPVSLFYSDLTGGNWSTIASGLQNNGEYAWLLDERVPEQIYLRLEVRDEAGNLAVYETPRAVTIQRGSTGARIRDVRPVGQSARRLPKRLTFR